MADLIAGDRRTEKRYNAELAVRFRWQSGPASGCGTGVTRDFSRRSVMFYTSTPPIAGASVELDIDWPHLLQGICRLELHITGRVVRCNGTEAAVIMERHEFRTCGERSFEEDRRIGTTVFTA